MGYTGIEKDIDLPSAPTRRTRGLLADVASPIPADQLSYRGTDRFPLGVEWLPWGTGSLSVAAADFDVVYNKQARDLPDLVAQPAFLLFDSLRSSTLGYSVEFLSARIERNFEVYQSAAFAAELATGTASGGIGLHGNATYVPTVVNGAAVALSLGFAHLEASLASLLSGGEGIIHLTPGLLGSARALGLIEWLDGKYRTASGHCVIGDAGFSGGVTPQGQAAAGAGNAWIYASGPIWTAISTLEGQVSSVDGATQTELTRNINRPLMERYGLVVFDPNVLAAARVVVA